MRKIRWLWLLLWVVPVFVQAQELTHSVAWTADGKLYTWQNDGIITLAENNAVQPFLSPDGATIAYTSGSEGLPLSLWIVSSGGIPQQLVSSDQIDNALIDQIEWLGNKAIYFNTSVPNPPLGIAPNNDLWRVDVDSLAISPVLVAGEGGAFAISPDEQRIAVVHPGTFDEAGQPQQAGDIRVINPVGEQVAVIHTFEPVTGASHVGYYPLVRWLPDSMSLYTAIPSTLFEAGNEFETSTAVWQLRPGSTVTQVTSVNSDGRLLEWSADVSHLYYGEFETGEQTVSLTIAEADGSNSQLVTASAQSGLVWSEAGTRFAYLQDEQIVIGEPNDTAAVQIPVPDDEVLLQLRFPDENTLVTLSGAGSEFVLRIIELSDESSINTEIFRGASQYGIAFDVMVGG